MKNSEEWKTAFADTIPVMTGYIVLGIAFGVYAAGAGLGIIYIALMSLVVYAGSMEFVLVSLITSGASLVTCAVTTLLVNARHLFYGISMVEEYRSLSSHRWYTIFALTDETYSLVLGKRGKNQGSYYFRVSLLNQIYWNAGTLIGACAGKLLPVPSSGIEFSMTALFVSVFAEQWLQADDHRPALAGVLFSVVSLMLFGSSSFLVPAMIMITGFLLLSGKKGADQ